MKILLVDKDKTTHEIDPSDYPILKRGGKGHKLVKGPVKLAKYIDISLLDGQTVDIRCPSCDTVRVITGEGVRDVPGRLQRVWYICKSCR